MYDNRYNAHCKSQLYNSHVIASYKGCMIDPLALDWISHNKTDFIPVVKTVYLSAGSIALFM